VHGFFGESALVVRLAVGFIVMALVYAPANLGRRP